MVIKGDEFMEWIWLGLTVAFIIVEITTVQLVSVWLALSAGVTAIISAIFKDLPIIWQVVIFVVLSAVLIASTRPFVKKFLQNKNKTDTNLDLIIDKTAIVVEEINNIQGVGAVKINGLVWSARSVDDTVIAKDELVVIKSIDGNKAMVEKKVK